MNFMTKRRAAVSKNEGKATKEGSKKKKNWRASPTKTTRIR